MRRRVTLAPPARGGRGRGPAGPAPGSRNHCCRCRSTGRASGLSSSAPAAAIAEVVFAQVERAASRPAAAGPRCGGRSRAAGLLEARASRRGPRTSASRCRRGCGAARRRRRRRRRGPAMPSALGQGDAGAVLAVAGRVVAVAEEQDVACRPGPARERLRRPGSRPAPMRVPWPSVESGTSGVDGRDALAEVVEVVRQRAVQPGRPGEDDQRQPVPAPAAQGVRERQQRLARPLQRATGPRRTCSGCNRRRRRGRGPAPPTGSSPGPSAAPPRRRPSSISPSPQHEPRAAGPAATRARALPVDAARPSPRAAWPARRLGADATSAARAAGASDARSQGWEK